jgi:hypothetical protein
MPDPLPEDFIADLDSVKPITNVFGDFGRFWRPTTAMAWYDGIIDDLLSHPGTTIKDCAQRLGRSYGTVSTIYNSDLFKARYRQRREAFEETLKDKLTDKLVKVAEAALDHTLTALEKKRDAIPLPLLNDIAKSSLDRLGYGPQPSRSESPLVTINNANNSATVSPEGLARARAHLQTLESSRVESREARSPLQSRSPVAGQESEIGEESEGED